MYNDLELPILGGLLDFEVMSMQFKLSARSIAIELATSDGRD